MYLKSNGFAGAVLCCVLVGLSGCSGSEIEKMSDTDLRTKLNECDYQVQTSSVRDAQTCHNYRRECARRLQEEGRFVCK